MNKLILLILLSIVSLSSAQATVQKPSADYYEQVLQAYAYALSRLDFTLSDFCINQPDVQKRGDVFYLPNEEVGITATSICAYKEQYGKYASKGKLINGKFDGKWTYWYENGQIKSEQSYNNGNLDGNHTAWYEDGQMRYEKSYKDGKHDGKHTAWYEDGQIKSEKNYSYGKADGKHTTWYENGQKYYELNYKWGKDDGKWTFWHEDGQVQRESNYKDGVCLSGYCLNW